MDSLIGLMVGDSCPIYLEVSSLDRAVEKD